MMLCLLFWLRLSRVWAASVLTTVCWGFFCQPGGRREWDLQEQMKQLFWTHWSLQMRNQAYGICCLLSKLSVLRAVSAVLWCWETRSRTHWSHPQVPLPSREITRLIFLPKHRGFEKQFSKILKTAAVVKPLFSWQVCVQIVRTLRGFAETR